MGMHRKQNVWLEKGGKKKKGPVSRHYEKRKKGELAGHQPKGT